MAKLGLVIKRQIFCRLSLTGNLNLIGSALAMIFYVELKVVSGLPGMLTWFTLEDVLMFHRGSFNLLTYL